MHLPFSSWLKWSHDCVRVDSESRVGWARVNKYSVNNAQYTAECRCIKSFNPLLHPFIHHSVNKMHTQDQWMNASKHVYIVPCVMSRSQRQQLWPTSDTWQSCAILSHNFVEQLLMHCVINLLNKNHLYSLAIYRQISELWLASLLFTCYSRVAYRLTRKYWRVNYDISTNFSIKSHRNKHSLYDKFV